MKKIVLFGAFDRYNYGDNIMPILFEMFVKKYSASLLEGFEFEYAAISDSDLSQFQCKKTVSINKLTDKLISGSVVVIIGGEVLCTLNQTLFLHMQNYWLQHFLLKVARKLVPNLFARYANYKYSSNWEYPFIPPLSAFNTPIKLVFNTVGGDIQSLNADEQECITKRLLAADYLSVRDKRTFNEIKPLNDNTVIAPDSAYIMSDLLTKEALKNKVGNAFLAELPKQFIVFQAAPLKVGCGTSELITLIAKLAQTQEKKIVLLPIGYASGHDDDKLLKKINQALPKETLLLNGLTIWQIMLTIANADVFIGTSLHGVITAMSYKVPHFGINPKVAKLDAFLKEWSTAPFNTSYHVNELVSLPEQITNEALKHFAKKSESNLELAKQNFYRIIETIIR